jgi:hypothetical protein
MRELFVSLGLKISEKSDDSLTTSTVGLGFVIDNATSVFRVPEEKRKRYKSHLTNVLSDAERRIPQLKLDVAAVAGRMMSLRIAVGDVAHLKTRHMFKELGKATLSTWSGTMLLSHRARRELQFWNQQLQGVMEAPIIPHQHAHWPDGAFDVVIYTDASESAWGAHVSLQGVHYEELAQVVTAEDKIALTGNIIDDRDAIENFLLSEVGKSSTLREAIGVVRALETYIFHGVIHCGSTIRLKTDNLGLSMCWRRGSGVDDIHEQLILIDDLVREYDLTLDIVWVPREENQHADWLSKAMSNDRWSLNPEMFTWIEEQFGVRHSVDAMAAPHNVMSRDGVDLPFFSKWRCRDAEKGGDFFQQDLARWDHLFVNPDFRDLNATITHLQQSEATVTLIVPSSFVRAQHMQPWFSKVYDSDAFVRELPLPPHATFEMGVPVERGTISVSAVWLEFNTSSHDKELSVTKRQKLF